MTIDEREAIPKAVEGVTEDDSPEPELLDVGEHAEVMAHLAHFEEADSTEVVARLGISSAVWEASHATWSERLRHELRGGQLEAASTFAQAFAARKRELGEQQPTLESIGELPVEEPARAAAAADPTGQADEQAKPPSEPPPEPAAAVALEVAPAGSKARLPARVRAASSSSPASPWAARPADPPAAAAAPSPRAALEAPDAAFEAPEEATERPQRALVDETVLGVPVVEADPLPFEDRPKSDFQANPRRESARARPVHDQVGETQEVSALLEEGPALPFEGASPKPPAAQAAPTPAERGVDETQAVSALLDAGPALPFAKPAATDSEPKQIRAKPPLEPVAPQPPEPDLSGATQAVSALLDQGPALPFGPPSSKTAGGATAARLTLEQYASLRAELAMSPETEAQILERYGIRDAANFDAIDAAWSRRAAGDPQIQKQLDELVPRFRAWLAKREHSSED